MNEILQWSTVAIIIAIAVAYIARKIFGKKGNSCAGCELSDLCRKQNCDNITKESLNREQKTSRQR